MFASLVSTPVVVSLARADGVASSRASRASASVPTVASSPRGDADRVALTRRGILGAAALAAFASPAPAHARRANKFADLSSLSPAEQRYAESTLNLIAQTSALVDGRSTDVDAWLAQSQAWYGEAKDSYSPKSQGKSFLMTTKLVAYLKNALATLPASEFDASNPPFDVAKTKDGSGTPRGSHPARSPATTRAPHSRAPRGATTISPHHSTGSDCARSERREVPGLWASIARGTETRREGYPAARGVVSAIDSCCDHLI